MLSFLVCYFAENVCALFDHYGNDKSYRLVTVKSSTLKCDMAQIRVVTLLESASLKSETELVHLRLLSVPEIYDS